MIPRSLLVWGFVNSCKFLSSMRSHTSIPPPPPELKPRLVFKCLLDLVIDFGLSTSIEFVARWRHAGQGGSRRIRKLRLLSYVCPHQCACCGSNHSVFTESWGIEAAAVAALAPRGGGFSKQNRTTPLLLGAFACHWSEIYLPNVWL